jgi:catechol 2,3-dioxygenase-like lactoylglutathione lyase family enzyme
MFDRVTVRVADLERSRRFYALVLETLGLEPVRAAPELVVWDDFAIAPAGQGAPRTSGLHIGFVAPSREDVDRFWQAGIDAGYQDDGPPGPRPQYGDDYYGGFLLDPDGLSAEAVHHGNLRRAGAIDHVWIRVADVAASKRFYAELAPKAGLRIVHDAPDRVRFTKGPNSGSFSVLRDGPPAAGVELALAATANWQATDPDGNRVQLVA